MERRLGVPTTLWAADPRPTFGTPAEAARRHLKQLAAIYDLSTTDIDSARVEDIHDTGRGAVIVTLRQYVHGVPVFGEKANVMMSRDLGLVGIGGYLSPAAKAAPSFRLSERDAIGAAASDLLGKSVRPADVLAEPARVKRVMYRLPDRLAPAYYVEVHTSSPDEYFAYVIDAGDGRVLHRENLTSDADFSYRVWAEDSAPNLPLDGPQGNAGSPKPTPVVDTFEPPFATPSLVALTHGPISTNDPWLPDAATETVGNNADAYADISPPDGFTPATSDLRASLTSAHTFDHTYDTSAAPLANTEQTQAAITQAFYTVNFLHDWYYDSGFDEASGNAQQDNYGRGGLAGDPIKVEAQDSSGTNNANMSTPSDGAQPRMQLYLWPGITAGSLTVNSPGDVAGDYQVGTAVFGPSSFQMTGNLAAASPADGCSAITGVTGLIAVIDRGTCGFKAKVLNAQNAGATGAIIVNNTAGLPPNMGDTASIVTPITIPTLSVTQSDGNAIKAAMAGATVNATMHLSKNLDRDGALDNEIVAHEWGHYISHRLVGSLATTMAGGLGEGWGDFTALLMIVRAEDAATDFGGVYPATPYVVRASLSSAYYFGLRRVPYSTDFTKNALTFKNISDGQSLPAGVPTNDNGGANSEVHNTGEIWATMLWEAYAGLLRDTEGLTPRLTFDQAQQRMRDYLVAAYKMTPNDPTLLEARDALLMAASANDPQDAVVFWDAFARRGAGTGAVGPDRNSFNNSPVTESYITSGHIKFVSATVEDDEHSCDSSDGFLDKGETGHLRITVRNDGAATLDSTTATISTTNPNVQIGDTTIEFPTIAPFHDEEASTTVSLDGATDLQVLDFDISIDDPGVVPAGAVEAHEVSIGAGRIALGSSAGDDMLSPTSWSTSGSPKAEWSAQLTTGPLNGLWHGPDIGEVSDASLVSPVLEAGSDPVSFSVRHRFSFETSTGTLWDGGVIEVSTDGGTTWEDITTVATGSVGYVGAIDNTSGNPLGGRQAYGKASTGYPGFVTQAVDLGTALAGQSFRIRFRTGNDTGVGAQGWDIDEIGFTGLTNTPFDRLLSDPGCPEPVVNPPDTGGGQTPPTGGGSGTGQQPTGEQPSGGAPDTAPEISGIKLAGLKFRAARSGAAITASPIGTKVTFTLSEAATVTVRVERQAPGRQVGRTCRAETRKNRKAKKCVRFVQLKGTESAAGKAGSNSFRFTGRWAKKALALGGYRLRLTAADAGGHVSTAKTTPVFKIVRR